MIVDKFEVPIPCLRPRTGGIALFITLAAAVVLYANIISNHVYLLDWMKRYNLGWSAGFSIWFNDELLKTSWLPTLLYRGPHHQLAIAASVVDIAVSILVLALFITSSYIKKNFWQHWLLLALFVPTFTLNTTALLYNFIEHDITGRLDTYSLYLYASPNAYSPYGLNWLDFESWTCGIARLRLGSDYLGPPVSKTVWADNCYQSQLGRWLLLASWFAFCATALISWVAFRGLPSWRGKPDDEEEVEGGEGRVRLT
ncbi:hypothetical protein F5Y11DRAFT_268914 [Daldinia sp. FL1419]|nr:hypothetical protein F5Y11DRAFT_268914 [Daldinia sp. FL1419]